MDRRWIGIIIIMLIGMGCMYFIVDSSNTVGNAITVVKDVSIVVPPGFKISDSHSTDALLSSESNNESISISCIVDDKNPEKEFTKAITSLQNKNNVELKNLSNKTIKHVNCKDVDSGKNTSFILFEKEGHPFIMKMENYESSAQQDKDMMFIIDNIQHDFKQNK